MGAYDERIYVVFCRKFEIFSNMRNDEDFACM